MSELTTLAEAVASIGRQRPEPAVESRHALPAVVREPLETVHSTPVVVPAPARSAPEPELPRDDRPSELDQARETGFQQGMEHALSTEIETLRARAEEEHATVRTLVGSIEDRLERLSTELERGAFRFALAVAGRIVKGAVEEDREIVVRQIRDAVRRVVGVESIILRVHPSDEPVVREQRDKILSSADSIRKLVIESDEAIERGGCIIETASGTIDARITTQLKQIETVFFGSQASGGTS